MVRNYGTAICPTCGKELYPPQETFELKYRMCGKTFMVSSYHLMDGNYLVGRRTYYQIVGIGQ